MDNILVRIMNNLSFFSICCILFPALSLANEKEQVIDQRWYDTFPASFCKRRVGFDFCLKWVSEYVSMKHIMANNDYYFNEIERRMIKRLKALGERQPYDPEVVKNIKREARLEILTSIANDWLRTGKLPCLVGNAK